MLSFYPITSDNENCIIKQVFDEAISQGILQPNQQNDYECADAAKLNVFANGLSIYFKPICNFHSRDQLLAFLLTYTLSLESFINSNIKVIYNKPISLRYDKTNNILIKNVSKIKNYNNFNNYCELNIHKKCTIMMPINDSRNIRHVSMLKPITTTEGTTRYLISCQTCYNTLFKHVYDYSEILKKIHSHHNYIFKMIIFVIKIYINN